MLQRRCLVRRALIIATLILLGSPAAHTQPLSVLHIKIVIVDADQKATPVPRHVLLVSDNPSSAPPREVVTALDGTADIRLRPGNYTIESDRPVVFQGKSYQWTQIVDVAAGRDGVLELTADNAEIEPVLAAAAADASFDVDPLFVLPQWQDSVVALWTPTAHASGFVIDARGLIATNQRAIGTATSVEVQLSPMVKVAARVLAADQTRDVAVLHVDPAAAAGMRAGHHHGDCQRPEAVRNRRSVEPAEGHHFRNGQERRASCDYVRCIRGRRQRGRAGIRDRWWPGRAHVAGRR
jgi:trypsin-like peptidase